MDGWAGSSDWKVDAHKAMLLNDGTASPCDMKAGPTLVAPYQVKIADYAVEANIQILRYGSPCLPISFGLSVRGTSQPDGWKGYMAGADLSAAKMFVGTGTERLTDAPFTADTSWHTYRVEVKDNEIKVLLDGSTVIDTLDNHYLSGEQVGLWCYAAQLQVSSFVVSTV
jgi:hypothetical protein